MWRNRVLYFFMCVILGLFFILYNIRATLLVFGVILLFPFVSGLLLRRISKHVTFDLGFGESTTHRKEKSSIFIRINNRALLPISRLEFDVVYENSLIGIQKVKHIALAFLANTTQEVELVMASEYVGNVVVTISNAVIWDYSFCNRRVIKCNLQDRLLILPEEFGLEGVLHTGCTKLFENESILLDKPGTDLTEILSVREYIQGDRISRVHWKLSSKCDELMIKEYASQLYYYPFLLVDLRKDAGEEGSDLLEGCLEAFFNLGIWHIEHGHPFEAGYYPKNSGLLYKTIVTSREVLYSVFQEVYNQIGMQNKSSGLGAFYASNEAGGYSNVIYFSADVSGDVSYLRQLGAYLVLLVRGELAREELQRYEMELGCHKVSSINIYDCQESCQRMVSQYLGEQEGTE